MLNNSAIQELIASEYNYFTTGAKNYDVLGGVFSIIENYKSIASAATFHNIDKIASSENLLDCLESIEKIFLEHNINQIRFYLNETSKTIDKTLFQKAYKKITEIGLLYDLNNFDMACSKRGELRKVETKKDWEIKKSLYLKSKYGPDGHDMQAGAFADFEKLKCDSEYMQSYLFFHENLLIGTVSLAVNKKFARLKNLYVAPDYRNKGFGKDIVLNLMLIAKEKKADWFGVFALEDSAGLHVYKSCKMVECIKQFEFTKEI